MVRKHPKHGESELVILHKGSRMVRATRDQAPMFEKTGWTKGPPGSAAPAPAAAASVASSPSKAKAAPSES